MTTSAWWLPESFVKRRAFLETRSRVLGAARAVFAARGFIEVETPALQRSPGLEPHLKA
ncbi:MAG: amino acid--tRNA ligase-related protein, partial [Stellaceae bacterium]